MEIRINNHQKKIPLRISPIKKVVQRVLKYKNVDEAELSIVFVSSQKIRALNKKYLNRTYATDVLAFDFDDSESPVGRKKGRSRKVLGDVFISTDAVRQNVKQYKTSTEYELVLYVVHGILHLLGYDDHDSKNIKKMRQQEDEIMQFLGKSINQTIEPISS